MIGKQVKGRSFRGVLNYIDGKVGAQRIGGNMVGKTRSQLAAEFACSQQLNSTLQRAVYHVSLAVIRQEAQSDQTWQAIAKDYLKGMGFENCQHVVYRHTDTEHDHIHVIASRIPLTGEATVSDSWDYKRSEALVRELEKAYNLTMVEPKDRGVRSQTVGEIRRLQATGEPSVREQLKPILIAASADSPTMRQFVERVLAAGVEVKTSPGKNRIRGISYALADIAFSGTHIGRDYTFPGLQKHRHIDYDPARDDAAIAQLIEQGPQLRSEDNSTEEAPLAASDLMLEPAQPEGGSQPLSPADPSSPIAFANKPELPAVSKSTNITQPLEEAEIVFAPYCPRPEEGKRSELDPLQKRCAEAIAPIAIDFFKLMQRSGELEEITPDRWQYKGDHYAITFDKARDTFAIKALDGRGLLFQVNHHQGQDTIEVAQGLGRSDIERFLHVEQILQQRQAEAPKPTQQLNNSIALT